MRLGLGVALLVFAAAPPTTSRYVLRGRELTLHLYGTRGRPPALVASGDGGWVHLGPQAAEILAGRGFFVVGLDSKQYLSAFTHGSTTLSEADVRRDFRELLAFAAEGGAALPVIVGVSEGAGLGVLAATDPAVQALVEGVIGLGLPDQNELGWRFRDSIIYLTKKAPKEPGFLVSTLIAGVAPVPLAMIHSTRDEFVPLEEAQRLYGLARDPRRLWVIDAADHRFRDKPQELAACLAEALDWVVSARGAGR